MSLGGGAPYIVAKFLDVVLRMVIAAARINMGGRFPNVTRLVLVHQIAPERYVRSFRGHVPQRRVDQTDGAAAISVPAWLFVLHYDGPDPGRINAAVNSAIVFRIGRQQSG